LEISFRTRRVVRQEIGMSEPKGFERIRDEIGKNDVLLFMKGTPVFPQCGFSAAVVDVLSQLGVKFHGINILIDPELREGIKEFSQWPTIPQLYVKGEFIGGCDIVREMFESGELEQVFKDKGVSLADAA
jgi:monothiol glutaredoxin